jgi:hypothetical protein
MNPIDAARLVVRDYPGGAASLAPRLGKAASSLSHEVDPNFRGAKLGLEDAVTITQLTGDMRILAAFAAECGFSLLPLPDAAVSTSCAITAVASVMHETADVLRTVSATMADGVVTPNEKVACRKEIGEAMRALMQVDAILEAQSPTHVRETV